MIRFEVRLYPAVAGVASVLLMYADPNENVFAGVVGHATCERDSKMA
jgi:hypothetical protein